MIGKPGIGGSVSAAWSLLIVGLSLSSVMAAQASLRSGAFDKAAVTRNLKTIVLKLSDEIGPRSFQDAINLKRAEDFIHQSLLSLGYAVEKQTCRAGGLQANNLVAERKGSKHPDSVIIIGAHYDTAVGTPGADDNASGVAALLELARLLVDVPFEKTVRFVAFAFEEPPFFGSGLMGSRVYARYLKQRGEKVEGMISLEMVGYYRQELGSQRFPLFFLSWLYPSRGNYIVVVSNFGSRAFAKRVKQGIARHSNLRVELFVGPSLIPGVDLSDHASFWEEGYQAVMLTDTAFYRNPYYHTAMDRAETLDFDAMAELVRGLMGTLIYWRM